MEFRTTFSIPSSVRKISYSDPVMLIGSCFANSIGQKLELGKMPVLINPSGTVYNPVSVNNTLNSIIERKKFHEENLYNHEGIWISFEHYTDFSSDNRDETIDEINRKSEEAYKFLSSAGFLFITFGTARVFRWNLSGKIVSNCHKIPASMFTRELLGVDEIISLWSVLLDRLKSLFPGLQIVFTVSPVRHWKDGAHGNQISKSVLFLAVEQLLNHPVKPVYFPAYELVMDDLRDYRFYGEDMIHLSAQAVDYIWEAFSGCYFDKTTINIWKEVAKISKAVSHRIQTGSKDQIRKFAMKMVFRIEEITCKYPDIDLGNEKGYFLNLLK